MKYLKVIKELYKVEFLYLKEQEMIDAGVLNTEKCVNTMDLVFQLLSQGDYVMGGPDGNDHGIMLWFPEASAFPNMPIAGPDRRFMSLISYLGGDFNICCNKWYGSNIENRNKDLPRSIHTVTLNDPDTGAPLSIMPGNLISSMRTGAIPAVFTRHLASSSATNLGAVGGGLINQACIRSIVKTKPDIDTVYLYDIDFEKGKLIAKQLEAELNVTVNATETLKESVELADVLTIATSGYKKPRIEKEWIKKGCLITLTGAADFPDEVYTENRIVADQWEMHQNWLKEGLAHEDGLDSIKSWAMSGQLLELVYSRKIDESKIINLGDIVTDREKGRLSEDEVIICMTGGLPVEDAAWAYEVYEAARKKGLGTPLQFWESPQWV